MRMYEIVFFEDVAKIIVNYLILITVPNFRYWNWRVAQLKNLLAY